MPLRTCEHCQGVCSPLCLHEPFVFVERFTSYMLLWTLWHCRKVLCMFSNWFERPDMLWKRSLSSCLRLLSLLHPLWTLEMEPFDSFESLTPVNSNNYIPSTLPQGLDCALFPLLVERPFVLAERLNFSVTHMISFK